MLKVKNLSIRYISTGQLAVKDVSFEVAQGQITAILGPSGCGKTTILNAISGLLANQEAEINGEIILGENQENLVTTTVFQAPRLLAWRSVLRNVSFGLEATGKNKKTALPKSNEIIKAVGLEKFKNYYPSQLSLGMQQRVNFARALVCNPDILLLDEPFSALDVETKETVQKEFKRILNKNKITSIFVTHSIEEAMTLADKIVVLSEGPSVVNETLDKSKMRQVPDDALDYINPFEE